MAPATHLLVSPVVRLLVGSPQRCLLLVLPLALPPPAPSRPLLLVVILLVVLALLQLQLLAQLLSLLGDCDTKQRASV